MTHRRRRSQKTDLVTLTIDGIEISVPKGTLVIRAAEQVGIQIPRFCDHPLLDPVGACRQCLVEVRCPTRRQRQTMMGRPMKPQASCTLAVADGMVVKTQVTSPVADKAQQGDHGVPADQPPARLPGLRQGRRVPAAEPGDVQRPRRDPVHRDQADLPQADQHLRPGAARPRALRAVRALHPLLRADRRRPVHRADRARCAAAGRHLREGAVRVLLLGQHHPDLPGRRADLARRTASAPGPFDLVSTPVGVRALRVRLRAAHRPPPRQGHAPARRQRPRGQRGVELRQGPLRVPLRPPATTGSPRRWSATRSGEHRPGLVARGVRASPPAAWPRPTARSAC